MKKSSHIVIGTGQIGMALMNVLKESYSVCGYDKKDQNDPQNELIEGVVFDVIHITFPYFRNFIDEVKRYQKIFGGPHTLTIIHSTIPVGTTNWIDNAVHSPIRGIHPKLEDGIKTFTKFFGGLRAEEAAGYFRDLKIVCKATLNSNNTEALKLWDTTIYGVNIALEKAIYEYCEKEKLDFDLIYALANETYNQGYEKLGHPEYKKYVLTHIPGEIGGHCVMQNLLLLNIPKITEFMV